MNGFVHCNYLLLGCLLISCCVISHFVIKLPIYCSLFCFLCLFRFVTVAYVAFLLIVAAFSKSHHACRLPVSPTVSPTSRHDQWTWMNGLLLHIHCRFIWPRTQCLNLVVKCVAYEKGHQRPALTVYTFQTPEATGPNTTGGSGPVTAAPTSAADIAQRASSSSIASRPPIPVVSSSVYLTIIP